jgi:RHS repeat-associated protein
MSTIDYDTGGNPIEVIDAQGIRTVMKYDDPNCPGQLTGVTAAVGLAEENTTSFEYDAVSCNVVRTVDPLLNETTLAYDSAGSVIESVDAEGRVTRFTYDLLNRITQVIDASNSVPDPSCGTAGVTCYDYDSAGNLTQITDARDRVTIFEYDTQNRLTRTTNPLGYSATFAYDGNGNLISKTDRKGQTSEFQYDAVNQLIRKTLLPGRPGEAITRFGYDSVGNLDSVVDPDSSLAMTYDPLSRLGSVSTTGSPNQPDVRLNYTYDKNGNRLTMTGPNGRTEYAYDELNRLTHLTNPSVHTVSFEHDVLGRPTQMNMSNGVTTSYTYDAASQLLRVVHQSGVNTINSSAYIYDKVGNRTSKTDNNGTAEYTYDELNRLVEAIKSLPSNPLETFTYDEVGNRVDSNQSGLSTFDAGNQLAEDAEFTYAHDSNGNQILRTNRATGFSTQFEYDAENRLIGLAREDGSVVNYRYDGLGRRIEKNVAGVITRYLYDNEDILLELDGSENILARYTHGPGIDEPLIMERDLDSSGTFESGEGFFYHADGLGSVSQLTDTNGTLIQSYSYSPFGQIELQLDPTLVQPYTFTSREFDVETGLHFYRARTYEAITGRFLQVDPIGFAGGINLYTYVGNSPMNMVDPFGLIGFKDVLKNPKVKAIGGAAVGILIEKLTEMLCPGPARGLVNLAGFAVSLEAGVAATALSVGSAVAAFGSVPTGVGPVAGILGTVGFGVLAIRQAQTASHFLEQAVADFRSSGGDCDLVCSEAGSQ